MIRENKDGCWGGGRFRIDFPGVVMVNADDEGGQEELEDDDEAAILTMSGAIITCSAHLGLRETSNLAFFC